MPGVLTFKVEKQEPYRNLCWAAVGLSVEKWRGLPGHWNQMCEVIQGMLIPPTGSCAAQDLFPWDKTGDVIQVLQFRQHSKGVLVAPVTQEDNSWDFIKSVINDGRVLCASIGWNGGGGHEIVIYGYEEVPGDTGSREIDVLDPLYRGGFRQSYSSFLTNYRQKLGTCEFLTAVRKREVKIDL